MSKYTDAIEKYKHWYKRGFNHSDMPSSGILVTMGEALEIADRLEQAMTDEQTADCIIVDTECVNNKHDKEVWLNGYNQALSDIRGDNNG